MHIPISEFGRIPRVLLGKRLLRRLQRFDEKHARHNNGRCVFDWTHISYVRALNFVGVIQVPGLTVEILPKVDPSQAEATGPYSRDDDRRIRAQQNLLYMLSFTRKIPILQRDLAGLRVQRISYFNTALFLPILAARLAMRVYRPPVDSENSLSTPVLDRLFGALFAAEAPLLSRFDFPVGVSLLALAQRPV
jgi:hypothetical protein